MTLAHDKASSQPTAPKGGFQGNPEELPPSYTPRTAQAANGSSRAVAFKTKPTNFLALSNDHNGVKGQFVIDPTISIPPNMLPPLGENETEADRKNLSLKSKYNSVHAEIWLLGSRGDTATNSRRTTVALESENGSITAQVHTVDDAAPFSLTANSPNGSIRVFIPQSFEGLLLLSTQHGSTSLDDAVLKNATRLSQLDDMQRYFVGDFSLLGEGEWQGDQMALDSAHGSVRVKYLEGLAGEDKKGFLSWLFGIW